MTASFEPPRALLPEEFALLPQARFEGEVIVAENPGQALDALKLLESAAVLGFDTETRPTFKRGVCYQPSLVQFAGENLVVLVRAGAFGAWDALASVIGNEAVVKAGVAVRDDLTALNKIGPVTPKAFEDVGEWAKRFGWPVTGLRNLAAGLLGLRVSKKARLTNWEARTLTEAQIAYAATDAWVSRELFLAMRGLNIKPKPKAQKKDSPSRALPVDRRCPE